MSDENEPATKQDLADLATDLATTLASKDDRAEAVSMTDVLIAMEKRLLLAIRHAANIMIEQIVARFTAIMEKYDGPLRQVPADLDAHRADSSLHTRPAPSAPKRTSRRKSLRRR